jgi:hypothetical protein
VGNIGYVICFEPFHHSVYAKIYAPFFLREIVDSFVIAVEKPNFSTDSTGFSTAPPPLGSFRNYAQLVDIIFYFPPGKPLIFCPFAIFTTTIFDRKK